MGRVDATSRMRQFLLAERTAQREFLAKLVRMASDNPPGDCAPHAELAASLLSGLGLDVKRHVVPTPLVQGNGMLSCTNLIVRETFGASGPVVALNAHGDVVPPGTGWTTDPYGAEVKDGFMYGRGAAVSKSDFATYVWALIALKTVPEYLGGTIELHLTYDEEVGGAIGPKWILDQGLSKPDYTICAGFSYAVGTAHNGCLHLEVEVIGRAGHAAEPDKAHDALEAASVILRALYEYRKGLQSRRSKIAGIRWPTLVVGLISGGINTNVVPDRIVFRIDRRITPDENPNNAYDEIARLISEVAQTIPGIRTTVRKIMLARPLVPNAGQQRLVRALQHSAMTVIGLELEERGLPVYTDARHYAEAGVPVVLYGAGPGTLEEANGHRADERVRLDDLYLATEVVALTLQELLGTKNVIT
jgi:succinyl-diaminopimelate desuccinylase